MKAWWVLYIRLPWDQRILAGAALLALIPIVAGLFASAPASPRQTAQLTEAQVDTHIPKGFVLVPIEVQNYEALDSILGQFGQVDLFQVQNAEVHHQRLVARNVRILRAPQNPSHFAVLVQESEVQSLLRFGGIFTVIVKRPTEGGTEFVKESPREQRTIVYEGS